MRVIQKPDGTTIPRAHVLSPATIVARLRVTVRHSKHDGDPTWRTMTATREILRPSERSEIKIYCRFSLFARVAFEVVVVVAAAVVVGMAARERFTDVRLAIGVAALMSTE